MKIFIMFKSFGSASTIKALSIKAIILAIKFGLISSISRPNAIEN